MACVKGLLNLWIILITTHPTFLYAGENIMNGFNPYHDISSKLQGFINERTRNLKVISNHLDNIKSLYSTAEFDGSKFILNPVNCYLAIKRFLFNWKNIRDTANSQELIDLQYKLQKEYPVPQMEDYEGALSALYRLQMVYGLNTNELATGKINGTATTVRMDASDYYMVGKKFLENRQYHIAVEWFELSLRRLKSDSTKSEVNHETLLVDLAEACWRAGFAYKAFKYADRLYDIPGNTHKNLRSFYEKQLTRAKPVDKEEDAGCSCGNEKSYGGRSLEKEYQSYEALCKGISPIPIRQSSRLKCRYMDNNNPYLKIMPYKIEELHLFPHIIRIYNVSSDKQIEEWIRVGSPLLSRSKVIDDKKGHEPANYRISQSGWMGSSQTLKQYDINVLALTNLLPKTGESWQLANYGIAGQYEPHFDGGGQANKADSFPSVGLGDRIATWMVYLSEVELGGYTVFPNIGVISVPIKGTALFWYNLNQDGTLDKSTLHAACPVLYGDKWVMNKWYHEFGNEFTTPCNKKTYPRFAIQNGIKR